MVRLFVIVHQEFYVNSINSDAKSIEKAKICYSYYFYIGHL